MEKYIFKEVGVPLYVFNNDFLPSFYRQSIPIGQLFS